MRYATTCGPYNVGDIKEEEPPTAEVGSPVTRTADTSQPFGEGGLWLANTKVADARIVPTLRQGIRSQRVKTCYIRPVSTAIWRRTRHEGSTDRLDCGDYRRRHRRLAGRAIHEE